MKLFLDIGATNTRILKAKTYEEKKVEVIKTSNIESLTKILNDKLENVKKIVIAAAGPKNKHQIKLTNANLTINQKELEKKLQTKVVLINDLESQASYFKTKHSTNLSIVAIGTGLGVAHVINKKVIPSEAGHIKQNNHEFETLLSGKGLQIIHKKIRNKSVSSKEAIKNKEVQQEFLKQIGMFCQILALTNLPQNIILSGGVIQKNHEIINIDTIRKHFEKNNQSKMLKKIKIIKNKELHVGIKGAITF